jgi:hypothetical protein
MALENPGPNNSNTGGYKRNRWKIRTSADKCQILYPGEVTISLSEILTQVSMFDIKVKSATKMMSMKFLQRPPLHRGKS